LGPTGEVERLKITGSRSSRIRELYKKTIQEVKTSGTQFSKAVDQAKTGLDGKVGQTTGATGKKGVSGAAYDDVQAKIEAKTEEFAAQAVASAPDIREAKVNAIQEAIKNKTYKIDAEAVAERLMASGLFDDLVE
jgi:flagellar biosynthesis anti-sigma factor FlgM